MAYIIERSGGSDANRIADLAVEIWREHYTPIIGSAQVEYMLAQFQSTEAIRRDIAENGYVYYLASREADGQPVGYAAVCPCHAQRRALLSKLYVRKCCRGMGIARRFLELAIADCRAWGYSTIQLTVNKHNAAAIAAYNKLGFTKIGSVVKDIGGGFIMDDYVMGMGVGDRNAGHFFAAAERIPTDRPAMDTFLENTREFGTVEYEIKEQGVIIYAQTKDNAAGPRQG